MTLAAIADELYALPPEEFVAVRDARAREARGTPLAAEVRALRRPSVAAAAVDALVRAHPAVVEHVLALGAELRAAQAALAGEDLRRLARELRAALATVRPLVPDAAWRAVEATLRAATVDAGAARAVATGRLVRPLEATGLEVDLDGAVAVPDGPTLVRPGGERSAPPPEDDRPTTDGVATPKGGATADRSGAPKGRARKGRASTARAAREAAQRAAREEAERAAELARIVARRREIADRVAALQAELDELRAEDRALARDEHRRRT